MTYREVNIYAYMEHMQYHRIDDDGNATDEVAEYDHDPQQKGWEIYSMENDAVFGGELLNIRDYPTLSDVKNYIDNQIKTWEKETGNIYG